MKQEKTKEKKQHIKEYILQDTASQNKLSLQSILWLLMIGYLILFGVIGVFACYISDTTGVLIVAAVGFGLFTVSFLLRDKPWMWGNGYGAYLIFPAAILVNPLSCYQGLMYYINQNIGLWNQRFHQHVSMFDVQQVSFWSQIHFMILLMIWVVMLVHMNLIRRSFVRAAILVATMLVFVSAFGLSVSFWCIVSFLLGWLGIWTLNSAYKQRIIRKVYFFLAVGSFAFVTGSLVNGFYSQSLADAKEKMGETMEDIRYGTDTLPEGDMTTASGLIGSDQETLQLTMTQAQEMYLRSYVGGDFDGTQWNPIDTDIYYDEYSGMMDWLESMDFATSYQYANYKALTEATPMDISHVQVQNVGANRKYIYLPYTVQQLTARGTRPQYDWQVLSRGFFGSEKYSFDAVENEVTADVLVQQQFISDDDKTANYQEAENVYQAFVHDNYLQVSEEEQSYISDTFFHNQISENMNVSEITQQIRTILQTTTIYSDAPYPYDQSEDFIPWFMNTEKLGNACYYATAAVLAYRMVGILARYVEGYFLSANDALTWNKQNANQQEHTYTITQKNAHAWAEIYIDGVGWMPVEVVPGYYYADYTVQQVLGTPQSSVNIQDSDTNDQLNGSTADSLEDQGSKGKTPEPEVSKRVWYILGILVIIIVMLWLCRVIILWQRLLRRKMYMRKLHQSSRQDASRMLYTRVCNLLELAGQPVQRDYPYDNTNLFEGTYENITVNDYRRFCDIIQMTVFGETPLKQSDYQRLLSFTQHLTEEVWKKLPEKKRLLMKYGKAYC